MPVKEEILFFPIHIKRGLHMYFKVETTAHKASENNQTLRKYRENVKKIFAEKPA